MKRNVAATTTFRVSEDISSLKLPNIGNHPKNSQYDMFDRQSCADFAVKAEKQNKNVEFTKSTMDEAFKFKAEQIFSKIKGRIAGGPVKFESMISRVSIVCDILGDPADINNTVSR